MKKLSLLFTVCILLCACKKERSFVVTGTVIINQGCSANSSLVEIDNPDPAKFSFLCKDGYPGFNCKNAAIILQMPASLAVPGKKIKFSKWADKGLICLSSTYGAHHLKVYDLSGQ